MDGAIPISKQEAKLGGEIFMHFSPPKQPIPIKESSSNLDLGPNLVSCTHQEDQNKTISP